MVVLKIYSIFEKKKNRKQNQFLILDIFSTDKKWKRLGSCCSAIYGTKNSLLNYHNITSILQCTSFAQTQYVHFRILYFISVLNKHKKSRQVCNVVYYIKMFVFFRVKCPRHGNIGKYYNRYKMYHYRYSGHLGQVVKCSIRACGGGDGELFFPVNYLPTTRRNKRL